MFEREKNFKQEPPFVTENIASSDIMVLQSVIVNSLMYLPGILDAGYWVSKNLDAGKRA